MNKKDKIILCAIRDLHVSIDEANIYIKTKNLLQAKLFLVSQFGFKLPLQFQEIPKKAPVAPQLCPLLKQYTDNDFVQLKEYKFNRPYNKIITIVNRLAEIKATSDYKNLSDTEWYEMLATHNAATYQTDPRERLMASFNNRPIENHQFFVKIFKDSKNELNDTQSPKIIKEVKFYDKYDIEPIVRHGLLLENNEILELSTKQYIPAKDYILIEEQTEEST